MRNLTPAKLVMLVFVAMGLMISFYIVKTLTAKEAPPRPPAIRNIPLALSDLEPGTVVTSQHIGMGPWPEVEITSDTLLGEGGILGRVVERPIKAAEPFHAKNLLPVGVLPKLVVSEGFRAVTLEISKNYALLDGLIRPGDFVDIHFAPDPLSGDPRYAKIGAMSIKLFKGVRVLAINRDFVQRAIQATTNDVTVEVSEKDTALLLLAAERGTLSFSLTKEAGGFATVTVADPDRPTLEEILQLPEIPVPEPPPAPPAPPIPPEPPKPQITQIYRGAGMTSNSFTNGQLTGQSGNSSGGDNAMDVYRRALELWNSGAVPGSGHDPASALINQWRRQGYVRPAPGSVPAVPGVPSTSVTLPAPNMLPGSDFNPGMPPADTAGPRISTLPHGVRG